MQPATICITLCNVGKHSTDLILTQWLSSKCTIQWQHIHFLDRLDTETTHPH